MGAYDKDMVRKLAEMDEDFRDMYKTHKDYETRISRLEKRPYLGPEEFVEKNRLKKKKLALKEGMEKKLSSYMQSGR